MRIFFLLGCALCFFTACHPDPAPYIPADWKALSGFSGTAKIPVNSAIWDDQLHVITHTTLAKVKSATDADHELHGSQITEPLPMNSEFFMSSEHGDSVLAFIPSRNPSNFNAKRGYINLVDLIPDISIKNPIGPFVIADNGRGQILEILTTKDYLKVPVLFDVKMRKTSVWEVDTVIAKIIEIPQIQIGRLYDKVFSYDGRFLISGFAGGNSYVCVSIDSVGNTQTVAPSTILNIMPIEGKLYGSGFDGYFISEDLGKTWIKAGNNFSQANPGFGDIGLMTDYAVIDGHVIMLSLFHIQELIKNPDGTIVANNLDLKGLTSGEGLITIKEWNGQVYVISGFGIYSRSIKDFFTK